MHKAVDVRTITEQMRLEFVDAQGGATPLDAEFEFNPTDPFAVSVLFKGEPHPVRWTFARDLLLQGFYEPTGEGDVHVWPCLGSDGTAVVILELCSPSGEVLVQVGSREMHAFIQRMTALVPVGSEGSHLDLDTEINALLGA